MDVALEDDEIRSKLKDLDQKYAKVLRASCPRSHACFVRCTSPVALGVVSGLCPPDTMASNMAAEGDCYRRV